MKKQVIKLTLFLILSLFISVPFAMAGTGFYITITNMTPSIMYIDNGCDVSCDNASFPSNIFGGSYIELKPFSYTRIYAEGSGDEAADFQWVGFEIQEGSQASSSNNDQFVIGTIPNPYNTFDVISGATGHHGWNDENPNYQYSYQLVPYASSATCASTFNFVGAVLPAGNIGTSPVLPQIPVSMAFIGTTIGYYDTAYVDITLEPSTYSNNTLNDNNNFWTQG